MLQNAAEKEKSPEKETTKEPPKTEEDPEAKKLSRWDLTLELFFFNFVLILERKDLVLSQKK